MNGGAAREHRVERTIREELLIGKLRLGLCPKRLFTLDVEFLKVCGSVEDIPGIGSIPNAEHPTEDVGSRVNAKNLKVLSTGKFENIDNVVVDIHQSVAEIGQPIEMIHICDATAQVENREVSDGERRMVSGQKMLSSR